MKAIFEMELPESCDDCNLRGYEDAYCWCVGNNMTLEYGINKLKSHRHPDCPLKIIDDREANNA